jgi:hypothetical protein
LAVLDCSGLNHQFSNIFNYKSSALVALPMPLARLKTS